MSDLKDKIKKLKDMIISDTHSYSDVLKIEILELMAAEIEQMKMSKAMSDNKHYYKAQKYVNEDKETDALIEARLHIAELQQRIEEFENKMIVQQCERMREDVRKEEYAIKLEQENQKLKDALEEIINQINSLGYYDLGKACEALESIKQIAQKAGE